MQPLKQTSLFKNRLPLQCVSGSGQHNKEIKMNLKKSLRKLNISLFENCQISIEFDESGKNSQEFLKFFSDVIKA